jgi:hypothetical protein
MAIAPSWFLGTTYDQKSGASCLIAWGLNATTQLAGTGQVVTAPVCTVTDLNTGTDVSASLLSGYPSIGPNAAGLADMVVTQAITNAVAGHVYELLCLYTPSPPSPSGERLPMSLRLIVTE